ncbi:MAG: DUF5615 family PIN-like protein [Verrucomicrobia bacterium]|nr:DUF5615 family PIN-like protein [Verrucomicrobiota bacterium]
MKILLDECLDWRLAHQLPGHDVSTVRDMGWLGAQNGRLLELAQEQFDLFVTVDHHLPNEQQLSQYDLAIVVLRAQSNARKDLIPLMQKMLPRLPEFQTGRATWIASGSRD